MARGHRVPIPGQCDSGNGSGREKQHRARAGENIKTQPLGKLLLMFACRQLSDFPFLFSAGRFYSLRHPVPVHRIAPGLLRPGFYAGTGFSLGEFQQVNVAVEQRVALVAIRVLHIHQARPNQNSEK